jgi:hypothetical protein
MRGRRLRLRGVLFGILTAEEDPWQCSEKANTAWRVSVAFV